MSAPYTNRTLMAGVMEMDANISETASITAAHMLIGRACEGKGYTTEELTVIETWLACHFYSQRVRQSVTETAGKVSITYKNAVGLGLKNTDYGQQAMMLDVMGGLQAIDEGRTVTPDILFLGDPC